MKGNISKSTYTESPMRTLKVFCNSLTVDSHTHWIHRFKDTHIHLHTSAHYLPRTHTHTLPHEISNRKIGLSFWPTWDWRNWLALQGQLAPLSMSSTENNLFLIIFSSLKHHTDWVRFNWPGHKYSKILIHVAFLKELVWILWAPAHPIRVGHF